MISTTFRSLFIVLMALVLSNTSILLSQQHINPVKDIKVDLQGQKTNGEFHAEGTLSWFYPGQDLDIKGFKIYVGEGQKDSVIEFKLLETIDLNDDSVNIGKDMFFYLVNGLVSNQNGWTFTVAAYNDEGESTGNTYVYAEIKDYEPQKFVMIKTVPDYKALKAKEYTYLPESETNIENAVLSYKLDMGPENAVCDPVTGKISWTPTVHGYFNFNLVVEAYVDGQFQTLFNQYWTVMVMECEVPAVIDATVSDEDGNPIQAGFVHIFGKNMDSTKGGMGFVRNFSDMEFSNGQLNLTGIDVGDYYIYVEGYSQDPNFKYYPTWYENAIDFTLAKSLKVECGDTIKLSFILKKVPMPKYYTISGKVVDAETQEGIEYSSVSFLGTDPTTGNSESFYTNTDFYGNYTVNLPDCYEYIGVAQAYGKFKDGDSLQGIKYFPQFYDNANNQTDAKIIKLTANIEGIDFYLEPIPVYENKITGSVVNSENDPLKDMYVAAFLVETTNSDMKYLYSGESAMTDDFGMFEMSNLIPGKYVIMAFPYDKMISPGFYVEGEVATLTWEEATRITVDETGVSGPYKIMLPDIDKIEGNGIVRGGVGKKHGAVKTGDEVQGLEALSGASVYLVNSKNNVSRNISTDNEGKFEMGNIAAGKYTLVIDKIGYTSSKTEITVGEEGVIDKDFTLESKSPTGVNDNVSSFDVSVYPNPATEMINIILPLEMTNVSVSLVNYNGTVVYNNSKVTNSNFSINTEIIPSGLYFVKVQTGDIISLKSVVVVK